MPTGLKAGFRTRAKIRIWIVACKCQFNFTAQLFFAQFRQLANPLAANPATQGSLLRAG